MNIVEELKSYFTKGNSISRIILINVGVFIISSLSKSFLFLLNENTSFINSAMNELMLPASFVNFIKQPWSIISYMFLHDGFFHILFNMLWLFWIGNIFHEYLGDKKVYPAYFGGGIFGGLFYMICYTIFPALRSSVEYSYALGASAGVLSIVVATATLLPKYPINLMFFGAIELRWIAIVSVALDLISIPSGNTGGHLAHLGGAFFGFLYIKYIYGKIRFPEWINSIFNKPKLKVHYSKNKKINADLHEPSQEEIDLILDKISKSGYESLSKKEKEILFKASKN